MKANHELVGDVNVFYLSGKMNLDAIETFQKICYKKYLGKKVVFNLKGLKFVGSTGVTVLLDTIRELHKKLDRPIKFTNVSSEYHKIFTANILDMYEPYELQDQAVLSYSHNFIENQNNEQVSGFVQRAVPNGALSRPDFVSTNSAVVEDRESAVNDSGLRPQESQGLTGTED